MRRFINHLTDREYQNRWVAFIENGSWAPMAAKAMQNMLRESKNLTLATTDVRINSSLDEKSLGQIFALAEEIIEKCD
jgi:flavorubredoxin